MKIKTWLVISYLVVMILPIITGVGLYQLVNHHHQKLEVEEYFTKSIELMKLKEVLQDSSLYQRNADYTTVKEKIDASIEINLYIVEGYRIFSTNPLNPTYNYRFDKDKLYENLYDFKTMFNHYYYKEPVFVQNKIIGFYEIKLARDTWISGIQTISTMVIILFSITLFIILLGVFILVKRKFIRPIEGLVKNFNKFPTKKEVIQFNKTSDEIGLLYQNVQQMQEALILAEKNKVLMDKEKEMLISSISHDLKTPLTSIRAFAESIAKNPMKASVHAPIIVEKAEYMNKMLADLLMFNLLQSPQYEMKKQLVDAEEVFEMLLMDYETLVEKKQINLTKINHVGGTIHIDVNQWMRLVDNLVMNAIKFTPEKGEIKIVATNNPLSEPLFPFTKAFGFQEGLYFIVENSGVGISETEIQKVFQPLYQVDTARTKENSGSGLGLTISKQILEKHNGSIEIISEMGIGTTVICYLPKEEEV